MANIIQKTILHPENSKEVDLYPKTSYEQVEGLDGIIAGINNKIDKIKPGGEMVLFSYPKGVTNGNISEWQLSKLQENMSNYINMVNDKELYYLNDNGHEDGYITYTHVGIENSKATIKTLTITVSAKSFVIVTTVVPTDAGGKLYYYRLALQDTNGHFITLQPFISTALDTSSIQAFNNSIITNNSLLELLSCVYVGDSGYIYGFVSGYDNSKSKFTCYTYNDNSQFTITVSNFLSISETEL